MWRAREIWVRRDHSRWLKMAPFDRSHRTSYETAVVSTAISCTIFRDIWRWRQSFRPMEVVTCRVGARRDLEFQVTGHSPYEFLHVLYIAEFCRHGSIFLSFTAWVCRRLLLHNKLYRVKLCSTVVQGHSRSTTLVPFESPHATFD